MRKLLSLSVTIVLITSIILLPMVSGGTLASAGDNSVLRIATSEDVDTLSPLTAYERASTEVFMLTYDSLVAFDENLEPRPDLAESWETSTDGLEWTFHLRQGVKWHDGESFTSKDVKFTYELLQKSCLGLYPPFLEGIVGIETPDENTVLIRTEKPKANMLQNPTPIMPEHIWGKIAEGDLETFANEEMVGTGPFVFTEWKKGEYLSLTSNPDYFAGKPQVDGVVFSIFTNRDTMVQSLLNGETDVALGLYPSQLDSLKKDANIDIFDYEDNGFTELAVNSWTDAASKGNKLLLDKKVRQAIDYAIDRQSMIDIAFEGAGQPGSTVISPATPYWHYQPKGEELRSFDPEKAKEVLETAGYTDSNGDGIREDKSGQPLSFRFMVRSDNSREVKAGQMIKGYLKDVGIETALSTVDDGALQSAIDASDFDLFIWGWGGDVDPTTLLGILTTAQIDGNNEPRYSNPEYDRLVSDQTTILDENERQQVVFAAQKVAYDDSPYIVLNYDRSIQAVRKDRLEGLVRIGGSGPVFYANTNLNYLGVSINGGDSDAASSGNTKTFLLIGVLVVVILAGVFYAIKKKGGKKPGWD